MYDGFRAWNFRRSPLSFSVSPLLSVSTSLFLSGARENENRHNVRNTRAMHRVLSCRTAVTPSEDERQRAGWVGLIAGAASLSPRSFHARMETGCGGLHVLLRAPANSCKGVVDDYNVADIVVRRNLMRSVAKLGRTATELCNDGNIGELASRINSPTTNPF